MITSGIAGWIGTTRYLFGSIQVTSDMAIRNGNNMLPDPILVWPEHHPGLHLGYSEWALLMGR
tara:strand:- start:236 stop:424 length:189 start_codon:yes stop_codon:yes gene_type:complete